MKPYIASHLRDMNRKTVFDLIASVGEISRSEIAQMTGISAPTVLKITNYLCDKGFIMTAGEGQSALGRKPQILKFNPNFAYSIGVDYEGDYLKMGIVNVNSEILIKKTIHVKNDFEYVVTHILIEHVEELINEAKIPKSKIHGIGIGLPGAVDFDSDEIRFGPLVGVNTYPLRVIIEKIQQALNIPVFVCNDANAAAIGEYTRRKLNKEDLVYISLGTGLGSGIILDGELRFGKHFVAGEIGYLVYDANFQTSEGKPGSLESLINLQALSYKFKDFETIISKRTDIDEIVDYIAPYLGKTILNIISVVDVNQIVLGGIVVDMLGENLVRAVSDNFSKLSPLSVNINLRKCDEPGIIGSSYLITNKYIQNIFTT
jgi:predicted NBD/HSP70 family sugar kinase